MSKESFNALAEKKQAAHPITRQIIDRECHVGLSNRAEPSRVSACDFSSH